MTPEELLAVSTQTTRDLTQWMRGEAHDFSWIKEPAPCPDEYVRDEFQEAVTKAWQTGVDHGDVNHQCDHAYCYTYDSVQEKVDERLNDVKDEKEAEVTKRDFEAIASAIRDRYTGPLRRDLAVEFARVLADTNPNFRREVFLDWATDHEMDGTEEDNG